MRKVAVVTGTRAEYGLLRWVMEEIRDSSSLELMLIATGTHLSPHHGYTIREIEKDGFQVHRKVEMLLSGDSPAAVTKSSALALMGVGDALADLKPDMVLLLGDRYEALAAAFAAVLAGVPIGHLHGGEITEGAMDDSIRHAITKLATWHFVAAEEYRNRVIQMGEAPERVHLVGGLGVDAAKRVALLEREEFEKRYSFRFGEKNLLATYHPVTNAAPGESEGGLREMLAALGNHPEIRVLFTMPNADPGNHALRDLITCFVEKSENAVAVESLGSVGYLTCLHEVDGVIGNSSSGLLEAPAFRKGTINIGDRQKGRLKAESVIDCQSERNAISRAISRLYSSEFQESLGGVVSPYGHGGASRKIREILEDPATHEVGPKGFRDLVPGRLPEETVRSPA